MRRRKQEPQGEGAYWMDTYGDMVTLLLTFFVLLFSFSTIDSQKWEELANALSGTPIVAVNALSSSDVSAPAIEGQNTTDKAETDPDATESDELDVVGGNAADVQERFDELYEKIKAYIEVKGLQDKLNVKMQDNVIMLRMTESALFDSGSDVIKPEAKEMLPSICEIIMEYDDLIKTIRVEGHTDNVPIQNSKFEDNWMLSFSRAHEVVLFMKTIIDIDPVKLDPAGRGEYHPVASNDTNEGKALNRRVDFVLQSILME